MKFNQASCKVLHVGQGNPKHKYGPDGELIESTPEEQGLGMLVDEKLNMTQECAITAQKANLLLSCFRRGVSSMSRDGILPLYPALLRPHLEYCIQLWGLHTRKRWIFGASPEKIYQIDQRAGASVL